MQVARDRLADRVRLLVDLLEHEAVVAALLGDLVVPRHDDGVALALLAVGAEKPDGIARRGHDLAVLDVLHAPGLGGEGGDRGGQEGLAVADADDQRALVTRADEQLRMVAVDRDEREVPLELRVRRPHRLDQIARVGALDEVGDNLGVGLRAEALTVGDQGPLDLAVVLDDAVKHDRDVPLLARHERVRVLLGHAAVRRPARVADARRGARGDAAGLELEVLELADRLDRVQALTPDQADPGRVIPAVLQPLQTVQEPLLGSAPTHISDYSAHSRPRPRVRGAGRCGALRERHEMVDACRRAAVAMTARSALAAFDPLSGQPPCCRGAAERIRLGLPAGLAIACTRAACSGPIEHSFGRRAFAAVIPFRTASVLSWCCRTHSSWLAGRPSHSLCTGRRVRAHGRFQFGRSRDLRLTGIGRTHPDLRTIYPGYENRLRRGCYRSSSLAHHDVSRHAMALVRAQVELVEVEALDEACLRLR